ncbi:hypothetical protein N9B73_01435 [Verrucomicrobiales bacterium]|nr:hypothetical protein [Verrucomicrobiales bacterium]
MVDDWVCVGSANFDTLSMRTNEELNIAFTDKKSANKLVRDLFEKDIRQSQGLYQIETDCEIKPCLDQIIDQL